MTEFDPAALLRQLRSKTPTKIPELPPRPNLEDSGPKQSNFDDRLVAIEHQLKLSQSNEQKYLKERDSALQQLRDCQSKSSETELRLSEKIKFLEAMLEREKQRRKEDPEEKVHKIRE